MKKLIIKSLLPKLLLKPCPQMIPRSGEEAESVDCFSIKILVNGELKFLVQKIDSDHFTGLWWSGNSFSIEACIHLNSISLSEIQIKHYYGVGTIIYTGITDYIVNGKTGKEKLKVKLHINKEKARQYLFNKKSFASFQRIDLLRILINHHIESNGKKIDSMGIMSKLYTDRWILHPKKDHQENQVQLFLDSFAESGELSKVQHGDYLVTGKAITTLSKYEENERRHKENKRMQTIIIGLTVALVLVGIIQATATYLSNK